MNEYEVGALVGFLLVAAVLFPLAMTPARADATDAEIKQAGGCINWFMLFVIGLVVAALAVNLIQSNGASLLGGA